MPLLWSWTDLLAEVYKQVAPDGAFNQSASQSAFQQSQMASHNFSKSVGYKYKVGY